MDMVGELVITEAMVTQNPEFVSLEIESFDKASRQLHKITSELQDMVMAIRMVPLSTTFMKMHRIVRDMTRKLNKNVVLEVYGEETEVDKNIIEKIADPLMHIIRNSLDHGIENEKDREKQGKNIQGTISLEAKNSGSDVLIIIKDDGKGLDKQKLYDKAELQGLVHRPYEEMSNRELYNLILHPGFSTKEQVTEFSGRGVGMDVVAKNIESIGGTVIVDSEFDVGTTIVLKIPLTLAIIEGMNIKVGSARFTLPIMTIKESFRPKNSEIIKDPEGQEMIMVRGLCYPIFRLYDLYKISTDIKTINALSNLQPLWAKDNLKKGAKYNE
jgi:two-component system chemotaxis sensor kinase CheA